MSDAELAVLLVRRAYEAQFGAPLPLAFPPPARRAPVPPADSGAAPRPSANAGEADGR